LRIFLIFVFSIYCSISFSQNDSVYLKSFKIENIKSKLSLFKKGNFYDLTFVKPKSSEEAIKQNLTTLPIVVIYNPKGEKLCRRFFYNLLPSTIDVNYIKYNYKKCYQQYREDDNGEKIPELMPYSLDSLLVKTQSLNEKEELNPNYYTLIFPWRSELVHLDYKKLKPNLKLRFKNFYKATKKQNLNLIRLNRDIQKSWNFGDSIGVNLIYHK